MSQSNILDRWLTGKSIALSISEPDDLGPRGLSLSHLNDAFTEVSRQLLALGAQLIYGGDLRERGYTELLFELVARYRSREHQTVPPVINVLPYPVHASLTKTSLLSLEARFSEIGQLIYLDSHGQAIATAERLLQLQRFPEAHEWSASLTTMRATISNMSDARIVIGGRDAGYRGRMPGILEEATLSNDLGQPLYIVGGFGGIARHLAAYYLIESDFIVPGSSKYHRFKLTNGLTVHELKRLAKSPHIDEVSMLILRGLRRRFLPGGETHAARS